MATDSIVECFKMIKSIGMGSLIRDGKYYSRLGLLDEKGEIIFAVQGTIPYDSIDDAEIIGCKILWNNTKQIFEEAGAEWGFGDDHLVGRGMIN